MSFEIYDVEKSEHKEIKMVAFLQNLGTPNADSNFARCPRCEGKLEKFEQPDALTVRESPSIIERLVGNRKLYCKKCGVDVSVEYRNIEETGEGLAYTEAPRFKIRGHVVPFFKKRLPLGWNYQGKTEKIKLL